MFSTQQTSYQRAIYSKGENDGKLPFIKPCNRGQILLLLLRVFSQDPADQRSGLPAATISTVPVANQLGFDSLG